MSTKTPVVVMLSFVPVQCRRGSYFCWNPKWNYF